MPDPWGEWRLIYQALSKHNRRIVRIVICLQYLRRQLYLPPPIRLALIASVGSFGLLFLLPTHPMTIPIAFGGGLAVAIYFH